MSKEETIEDAKKRLTAESIADFWRIDALVVTAFTKTNSAVSVGFPVSVVMAYRGRPFGSYGKPLSEFEYDPKFMCSISSTLIEDPVIIETGQIYDRKSIETWTAQRRTCPLTNLPFSGKLISSPYLKEDFKKYRETVKRTVATLDDISIAVCAEDMDFFFRKPFLVSTIMNNERLFWEALATGNVEMIRFFMATWGLTIKRSHLKYIACDRYYCFVKLKLISDEWISEELHTAVADNNMMYVTELIEGGANISAIVGTKHILTVARTVDMIKLLIRLGRGRISPLDKSPNGTPTCLKPFLIEIFEYWCTFLTINSLKTMKQVIDESCADITVADNVWISALCDGNVKLMQMVLDVCTRNKTVTELADRQCIEFTVGAHKYSSAISCFVHCVKEHSQTFKPDALELLKQLVGPDRFMSLIFAEDNLLRNLAYESGSQTKLKKNWEPVAAYFIQNGATVDSVTCCSSSLQPVEIYRRLYEHKCEELKVANERLSYLEGRKSAAVPMIDDVEEEEVQPRINKRKSHRSSADGDRDSDSDFAPSSSKKTKTKTKPGRKRKSYSSASASAASASAISVDDSD